MPVSLKPLEEQTLVVTGASSGIGLATARLAAQRGANVVMVSRDPETLEAAAEKVRAEAAGEVLTVAADVADRAGLEYVAQQAEARFGGFDTWINNAGVSAYGRLDETPTEDARQLFETNYWGVVHGSLVALERLRLHGGALINVGGLEGERALPLQGHYSASKHAVRGFTDALRLEVERDGLPVSVTLAKPPATDTPFPEHAANYMGREATLPPLPYDPEVVARALLEAAERPMRDVGVGAWSGLAALLGQAFPRLSDRLMEATLFAQQQREKLAPPSEGAVHDPAEEGPRVRGRHHEGPVIRHAFGAPLGRHPGFALLGAAALAAGLGYLATR